MEDELIRILVTLGSIGLIGILFWPESGFLARWRAFRHRTQRVLIEDILKYAHKSEIEGRRITIESIAGMLQVGLDEVVRLLETMERHHLLEFQGEEFHLTGSGRNYALHIIRAHRLWESYLADQTGHAETEWHRQAEQEEHFLTPEDLERLSAELRNPVFDPHGDPIPDETGRMVPHKGVPLTEASVDQPLRITHIEDEPELVYSQLVAEGLRPGMLGRMTESGEHRISFWTDGEEHVLAPILARNISVEKVETEVTEKQERLSDLQPGTKARVVGISKVCRGAERRRFLDLGILPGTAVEVELQAPSRNPRAYRIRGNLVALREAQAKSIHVDRAGEGTLK